MVWNFTTELSQTTAASARILTGAKKFDHISYAIREIGWTPIEKNFRCRDAIMMYKWKNNLASDYLCTKMYKWKNKLAPDHSRTELPVRSNIHRYNTRQSNDLNIAGYTQDLPCPAAFLPSSNKNLELA